MASATSCWRGFEAVKSHWLNLCCGGGCCEQVVNNLATPLKQLHRIEAHNYDFYTLLAPWVYFNNLRCLFVLQMTWLWGHTHTYYNKIIHMHYIQSLILGVWDVWSNVPISILFGIKRAHAHIHVPSWWFYIKPTFANNVAVLLVRVGQGWPRYWRPWTKISILRHKLGPLQYITSNTYGSIACCMYIYIVLCRRLHPLQLKLARIRIRTKYTATSWRFLHAEWR